MNKTIRAKRTTGRNGKPVITIDHICGDYAEFTETQLEHLADALLGIVSDVKSDRLENNKTREYPL